MPRRDFLKAGALSAGAMALPVSARGVQMPDALRLGHACHAFDHLGAYSGQAAAAAQSGSTVIYATGLGGAGYTGLPPAEELARQCESLRTYNQDARQRGIELIIGYLCATSVVKLETFDAGWSGDFRKQFASPPAQWLQEGSNGQKLPSWYGGDYRPACMNDPDWRTYQRAMVKLQLDTGHDGIFFDNPTVHPEGCYCRHCMASFTAFLGSKESSLEQQRALALSRKTDFLRYRATIARDFLQHIRDYARSLNPRALITANDSTNAPGVLYSQCRAYGYSPYEMSKAEDFVVVEDMATQPRTKDDGTVMEYAPTYKQLQALCHGKPLVAVTLAEADYHTPPRLMRLAIAEAFAHSASYLAWTTWPEEQRQKMIAATRATVDFYRRCQGLLQDVQPREDVLLFLPMRGFLESDDCKASVLATELSAHNLCYGVACEEGFAQRVKRTRVLLVESDKVLTAREREAAGHAKVVSADQGNWLAGIHSLIPSTSLVAKAPATVRATLVDQPRRNILHLLNLNVRRKGSFEDEVIPAQDIQIAFRARRARRHLYLVDQENGARPLEHETSEMDGGIELRFRLDSLCINALVVYANDTPEDWK